MRELLPGAVQSGVHEDQDLVFRNRLITAYGWSRLRPAGASTPVPRPSDAAAQQDEIGFVVNSLDELWRIAAHD